MERGEGKAQYQGAPQGIVAGFICVCVCVYVYMCMWYVYVYCVYVVCVCICVLCMCVCECVCVHGAPTGLGVRGDIFWT